VNGDASGPTLIPEADQRLDKNVVGLWGALIMTLAFMAPAMSLFFTTPSMVGSTGAPVPLAYLIAMVGVLCTGNALIQFSRRFSSTGTFVTFMSKGFGGSIGLVGAIVLLTGYLLAASTVICIFGSWTHDMLVRYASVSVPWQLISVVAAIVLTGLAVRGLHISTETAAVLFAFEVLVLVVVSVVVIVKGGHQGQAIDAILPSKVTTWNGFGLAAILAVYSFLGYEGAVPLGEETANPRRNTPLAVAIAIISLGILYFLVTYAAIVGFGVSHLDALASDSAFFDTMAKQYLGGAGIFVALAGFTSTLGSGLAILNVQPRILYNISRAGLFPELVSHSHPRWHTPWVAIIVFGSIITVIPLIGSAFGLDPLTIFAVFGTWGGLPITCIYMVVNLALIIFWFSHKRDGSPWTHLVIPLIGMAVWIWPIYLAAKPGSGLFGWTWIWVVGPAIAGTVFMLLIRKRRDPGRLAAVIAGESEAEGGESL